MSIPVEIPILTAKDLQKIRKTASPAKAMYSSEWGGVTTDPFLMMIPVDDHIVHRGDGIFEAIRLENDLMYLYDPHWQRMKLSAKAISLEIPWSDEHVFHVCSAVIKAARQNQNMPQAVLRIYISRGPGSFSANPYETTGANLYVIVTAMGASTNEKYLNGVTAGFGNTPWKEGIFAEVKSCNYLQNVLNKKEAVDRKLDYVIGIDSFGEVTESATENLVIVDKHGVLCRPEHNILKGTTMTRMLQIAEDQKMVSTKIRRLSKDDIFSAKEMMMIGTTIGVLPVTNFEETKVGDGKVGPVASQLHRLFEEDLKNPKVCRKI